VTNSPETLLAFVNERPVRLPPGASVAEAVRALDPPLADRLAAGQAYLTDGRGIRIAADAPLATGDIIRVVVSARRTEPDADA
jgi:hypothetical protein